VASANLTCTNAYLDVDGLSTTIGGGKWKADLTMQINMVTEDASGALWGQGKYIVNGVDRPEEIGVYTPDATRFVHQPGQSIIIDASGPTTVKVQAQKSAATGSVVVYAGKTTLNIVRQS